MNRTVVAIRHVAFEDLGGFEPVLKRAGYSVRYHDVGVDDFTSFETEAPDLLFVLGGPIGAYEVEMYPFLRDELRLIEARLKARLPLVGICLGAQLMAQALGSKVYPGPAKEIGFAPLDLTASGKESCLRFLDDVPVLHWHGDTFDLPQGATLLASTKVCENQAFSYGANAIAFQFHPEAQEKGFERWLVGHAVELAHAKIDILKLRIGARESSTTLMKRAGACLDTWLDGLM